MANSDGIAIEVTLEECKKAIKKYYQLVAIGNEALAKGDYPLFLESEKRRRDIKRRLKL